MNEKVEEVFRQMFAPEPIPSSVRNLFEKANFLGSRIDSTAMRPIDLAIIGAIGTIQEIDDTFPSGEYSPQAYKITDVPIPAPDKPTLPQTTPEGQNDTPLIETSVAGPTGPMDAPSKPDKKRRGLSVVKMQKMTVNELRSHASEFYGYKVPLQHRKPEIIAILSSKEPIK